MSTSYRNIARDLFFRMRALNKAAEHAEREGESGEAIRGRRGGIEEACMIVFGQGTGVELVKLSIDTHELLPAHAEVAVRNFISEKLPAEAQPIEEPDASSQQGEWLLSIFTDAKRTGTETFLKLLSKTMEDLRKGVIDEMEAFYATREHLAELLDLYDKPKDGPAESNLLHHELAQRFPLGLPVKDRNGRTGVVVGYQEGKVLVRETGVPSTETPPPVALAPEYIAPVHPRPSRYVVLASIEEAIVNAARRGDGSCVLALAQARALL